MTTLHPVYPNLTSFHLVYPRIPLVNLVVHSLFIHTPSWPRCIPFTPLLLIETILNRTAVGLSTAEWRKNIAWDRQSTVSRNIFSPFFTYTPSWPRVDLVTPRLPQINLVYPPIHPFILVLPCLSTYTPSKPRYIPFTPSQPRLPSYTPCQPLSTLLIHI